LFLIPVLKELQATTFYKRNNTGIEQLFSGLTGGTVMNPYDYVKKEP